MMATGSVLSRVAFWDYETLWIRQEGYSDRIKLWQSVESFDALASESLKVWEKHLIACNHLLLNQIGFRIDSLKPRSFVFLHVWCRSWTENQIEWVKPRVENGHSRRSENQVIQAGCRLRSSQESWLGDHKLNGLSHSWWQASPGQKHTSFFQLPQTMSCLETWLLTKNSTIWYGC